MTKDDKNLNIDKFYSKDAYEFINKSIKLASQRLDCKRHLNAYEVLVACRDLANQEYSFLADNVLKSWGIQQASDVGIVVYQMVNRGILSVSEDDNINDFNIEFELFNNENGGVKVAKKVHDPIIID